MDSKIKKDLTPVAMWVCLFAGILVLAVIRPMRHMDIWKGYPVNGDMVFMGAYLVVMLMEFRISKRDVRVKGKKTSDLATCQIYGAAQAITVLSALWFPSVWSVPHVAHLVGLSMFVLGAGYRLWAIRTLGQFYSHKVRMVAHHQIVASGPYRYTRHPAYAGMITAHAGLCVYFCNGVTALVFLCMMVPAIILRIVIEEKMLMAIEGYSEFAKLRKRLFPAVW